MILCFFPELAKGQCHSKRAKRSIFYNRPIHKRIIKEETGEHHFLN